MPSRYKRLSAVDLYAEFLKYEQTTKGMMATGYGSSGWGAGVYISVEPDTFILPGLFTLNVEASASVSLGKTVMLAIHRAMPRYIPSLSNPQQHIWSTEHPVALLALTGYSFSGQLAANASIGVGVELSTGSETADEIAGQISSLSEIPLAIEATATAGASYTYDRLYAIDPAPGWYPHSQDPGLKADFNRILYAGDRQTREELIRWINRFDSEVFPLNRDSLQLLNQNPQQIQQDFINRLSGQMERDRARASNFRHRVIGFAKNTFPTVSKLSDKVAGLFKFIMSPDYTAGQLIAFIDNLKRILPSAQQINDAYVIPASQTGGIGFYRGDVENLPLMQSAVAGMGAQLDTFRGRLVSQQSSPTPARSTAIVPGKDYNRFNCFLKIVSHTAAAEASLSAAALVAYANAGIEGKYKRTAYRYQTVAAGYGGSLIYTQDTSITYRLAAVRSSVGAAMFALGIENNFVSGMTYQSACVYWVYEEALRGFVRPRIGSGLSYGVSVRVDDLLRCIRAIQGMQTPMNRLPAGFPNPKLIYTLARYLRVSITYLLNFLHQVEPNSLNNFPLPAVLLESSFVVPLDTHFLQVSRKVKQYRDQSTDQPISTEIYRPESIRPQPFVSARAAELNNMPNAQANCQNYLDTLRLRGRMADYQDSSFTFKLGVPIAPVPGLTVGITLANIENAGREGVMESYRVNFRGGDDDERVPPVALFHQ